MRRVLMGILLVVLMGCQDRQQSQGPVSSAEWDKFLDDFQESYFKANPHFAVYQGRHEFDGKLPDWSPEGLKKEIGRLKQARLRATQFDGATLDDRQKFERDYALAVIDRDLYWMETAEQPFTNPTYYSGALDPNTYLTRAYAPLEQRLQAYIAFAKAVPAAAQQIQANLRTPMPRTFVDIGKISYGGLAAYFKDDVPGVFASIKDEPLLAEFRAANSKAIESMQNLERWFDGLLKSATDDYALGPEKFAAMLKATEGVDVSLDELERVGRADLDRNLASLKEACEKYLPGRPVKECIAKAESSKPEGGPVEGARRQLADLKKFVQEKQLVSIPGPEEALVKESPPYMRWNFAYIDIPGPYEKGLPSTYYVAPPDPSWTPQQRANYIPGNANLLFTSVHEVWPGHFLQFLHSNRSKSRFGQIFVGYAFAEGFAHYVEEMMWEAGLGNQDPEVHIGQLLNALLRNVRYMSAIGLHTKGMTVEESERMFLEEGFQDAATAKQQAARGTFDPAYLNYTMGKLMIRKLRDDWTATRGGPPAWRDFHDQVLSYGGPPIPLVRKAMLPGSTGSLF